MADESLDDLIQELQELRIRQGIVITRIQIAEERRRAIEHTRTEVAERAEIGHEPTSGPEPQLEIGARVRIKNKIRKPASSGPDWTESKERLARVTGRHKEQIHIITDNGTSTWRARNNLQRIN